MANQHAQLESQVQEDLRASVIIPHLNTPEYLMRCLTSVSEQLLDSGTFEIIVVDNGSTPAEDDSRDLGSRMLQPASDAPALSYDEVRAHWPEVKFLLQPEPGPGPARNMGAAAARAPVIIFIDADCRAAPGWLQAAVSMIEEDPSRPVGGDVRIDIRDPKKPSGLEAFSAVFSFRQKMYVERLGFSSGNCMACSKFLFGLVGDFGPINTTEDKRWGQKARAMGHAFRYCPDMIVYHPAPASADAARERWCRIMEQHYLDYQLAKRPSWHWTLYRHMVLVAAFGQIPKMLTSPRVKGLRGRVRGIVFLFVSRIQRFVDMGRIANSSHFEATQRWNR